MRDTWQVVVGGALLGTTLLVGAGLLVARSIVGPRYVHPTAAVPFTDLETAIAARGWHPKWVVHQQPSLPGPYRVLIGTSTIPNDPTYKTVFVHRDKEGNEVAPIELRGHADFIQMAVHLETADGQITGTVLRRPPDKK